MIDLYLAHHGIKGQKWGIRRYQNEDGSLTEEGKKRYSQITKIGKTGGIIPKGSTLYRVSMDPHEKYKNDKSPVYLSTNKFDNAMWEDTFAAYPGEKNYATRLKTLRDIKVAPEYEIGKAYLQDAKEHPYRNRWNTNTALWAAGYSEIAQKGRYSNAYKGGINISMQSPTGKRVADRLRQKGYTAVADMLGRDTANDPLISLTPSKDLKSVGYTRSHVTTYDDSLNASIRSEINNAKYNSNYS